MKALVRNELRMLLKRKTIVILMVSFLMVLPYIAILNADTPAQYEHYYYNEMVMVPFNATEVGNNSIYYHSVIYKGFVVNKNLQPVKNTTIDIENVTLNGEVNVTVRTNSNGIFNVTKNYKSGIFQGCFSFPNNFISERKKTDTVKDFQQIFFSVSSLSFYIPGVQGSQSDRFYESTQPEPFTTATKINYSSIIPGQYSMPGDISYSILPYYNLGLYGVAPVIYNGGVRSVSLNISEESYNEKLGIFTNVPNSSKEVNISAGNIVEPFEYSQILQINKDGAINIHTPYATSGPVTLSPPFNNLNFGNSFLTFAYLLGTLAISLLVISVITEIYGLPERDVYASLPHRRRNIVFMKFFTGLTATLITIGLGVAFGEILDSFLFHSFLSPYVILISTVILLSMFLLVSPIFLFIESKKSLSSGTKTGIVIVITLFLPVIVSVAMGILEAALISPALSLTDNYLTEPLINGVGKINLIFSIIPFSAPIEMIDYLTYTPFPGVTMFNHRSLFLLTPLVIIPDLMLWFLLILWVSIKRYERN